jgi:lysozyme family protein
MKFDQAFDKLIGHEGGYTPGKGDPGGETCWGISKRSYPKLDIASLTQADAKAIYLRDYWRPAGCDLVPPAIAFDLFDMAVNSGVTRAVKTLQRTVGTVEDGKLGPLTLAAAAKLDPARAVARFNGVRLAFMVGLDVWPTFSRGWALRIADNLMGV